MIKDKFILNESNIFNYISKGSTNYKKLSSTKNWQEKLLYTYESEFILDNHSWISVNNYVNACKIRDYDYENFTKEVTKTQSPNFKNIQESALILSQFAKFCQNAELTEILLNTKDAELYYNKNELMKELMKVRECIRIHYVDYINDISKFSSEFIDKVFESKKHLSSNFPYLIKTIDFNKLVDDMMNIDAVVKNNIFYLENNETGNISRALQEDEILKTSFWDIWFNSPKLQNDILFHTNPNKALYEYSQKYNYKIPKTFTPLYAKAIYKYFKATSILDPCMGWGDSMIGAVACNNIKKYVGFDSNKNLRTGYMDEMKLFGHKIHLLTEEKMIFDNFFEINSIIFEDGVKKIPDNSFDLVFTSPPFFSYNSINDFYKSLMIESCRCVKTNKFVCIHINDASLGKIEDFLLNTVYKICNLKLLHKIGLTGFSNKEIKDVWIFQKYGDEISTDIINFFETKDLRITDALARQGEQTVKFCKNGIKYINSVEQYCQQVQNITHNFRNVNIYCKHYLNVIFDLYQDCVFFNPHDPNNLVIEYNYNRINILTVIYDLFVKHKTSLIICTHIQQDNKELQKLIDTLKQYMTIKAEFKWYGVILYIENIKVSTVLMKQYISKVTKFFKKNQNKPQHFNDNIINSILNIITNTRKTTSSKITNIYDIIKNEKYALYFDDSKEFIGKNISKYFQDNKYNKNSKILDIGCGNGNILIQIGKYFGLKKENLFGLETQSDWNESYDIIKAQNLINLLFWDNTVFPNEIGEKSVDVFLIVVSLHHMKDKIINNLFNNINKFASKDAIIIIKEHDCQNPNDKFIIDWEHHLYHAIDTIKNNEVINAEKYLQSYIDNYKTEKQFDKIFNKYGYIEIDKLNRLFDRYEDTFNPTQMYWKIYKKIN